MELKYARKLHNGDEVAIEEDGEVLHGKVLSTHEEEAEGRTYLVVEAVFPRKGWCRVNSEDLI